MRPRTTLILALAAGAWHGFATAQEPAAIERPEVGAFAFEHVLVLPGSPEQVYDIVTGDISGWWDHNFSGDPARFVLEPWPGGRFLEVFEEGSRDGVVHATVTFAQRGEMLRFEGPLGLTGHAIHGVYTYRLEPVGDSTRLRVAVRMAGEMSRGWPETVEGAWRHFLFEGLEPYVESGVMAPRAWVGDHTLWVQSWPRVGIEIDPTLTYLGSSTFRLYDVAEADTHVFVEAGADSVVRRLYWLQVEEVLPTSDHRYDYSALPRTFEEGGLTFVADARFGPGYSLESVDREGDTAEVLRLVEAAGYRMPEQMMRLRAVTLDSSRQRELLVIYLEDLTARGPSAEQLEDDASWRRVAGGLQSRALEGMEIRRR